MQTKASHRHAFSPRCGDIRRPSLNASILLLCQINGKRHCHSRTPDVRCTLAARATVETKQQADIEEAEAAADTDTPGSTTPSTIEGKIAEGAKVSASVIQESGVERKRAKPTQKPDNIEDVVGFQVDFLIPTSKAGGFILGVGGKRLRYLMYTHEVVINMTPGSRRPLRTMGLTARSVSNVVAFWEDVLSMAERDKRVILDTVRDGSRYRLKMKVPTAVCGKLLGQKGATMKGIAERTQCLLKLQEHTDPAAAESNFRILSYAGNHKALIAAIGEVLTVLSEAPYFRRVLQVPAFISVPDELAGDVSEVLVDIRQRFPSLSKAEWVDKPGYASIPGGKRLMILGPPSAAAEAKEQLESLWGLQPNWSRRDWIPIFQNQNRSK